MNFVRQFETDSEEGTREAGAQIAALLPPVAVVGLLGDLGAGKTTLTKGIVESRGVADADDVSSPTFTLIHEYGDPVRVYHIDLYRLDSAEQAARLGLDELFDRPALVLIEWADRFPHLLPKQRYEIRMVAPEGDKRIIRLYSFE